MSTGTVVGALSGGARDDCSEEQTVVRTGGRHAVRLPMHGSPLQPDVTYPAS